jgi:hypothetical protein
MLALMLEYPWMLEEAGDFSSGSKQEQPDAGRCQACDLGYLAVGVVFRVRQP